MAAWVPQAGDGAPDRGARYAERPARCRRLRVASVAMAEETDVIMKRKPGQPGGEPEMTVRSAGAGGDRVGAGAVRRAGGV